MLSLAEWAVVAIIDSSETERRHAVHLLPSRKKQEWPAVLRALPGSFHGCITTALFNMYSEKRTPSVPHIRIRDLQDGKVWDMPSELALLFPTLSCLTADANSIQCSHVACAWLRLQKLARTAPSYLSAVGLATGIEALADYGRANGGGPFETMIAHANTAAAIDLYAYMRARERKPASHLPVAATDRAPLAPLPSWRSGSLAVVAKERADRPCCFSSEDIGGLIDGDATCALGYLVAYGWYYQLVPNVVSHGIRVCEITCYGPPTPNGDIFMVRTRINPDAWAAMTYG
jgi:hypothetical protein